MDFGASTCTKKQERVENLELDFARFLEAVAVSLGWKIVLLYYRVAVYYVILVDNPPTAALFDRLAFRAM